MRRSAPSAVAFVALLWLGAPDPAPISAAAGQAATGPGAAAGSPALAATASGQAPGIPAPAEVVRDLQQVLSQAIARFEARDIAGVVAHVSEQYRTGPLTKPVLREQIGGLFALYDAVQARVRIDDVRMVGEHAWIYSTGEVTGRVRWLGSWMPALSWERELEIARREQGAWRLYGYQQ